MNEIDERFFFALCIMGIQNFRDKKDAIERKRSQTILKECGVYIEQEKMFAFGWTSSIT